MKHYTVVLRKPGIVSEDWPNDTYTAIATGPGVKQAVASARKEAHRADSDFYDLGEADFDPVDYAVIAVFKGYPKQVGWSFDGL